MKHLRKEIYFVGSIVSLITEHDAYSSSKSDKLKNAKGLSQKILFLPIFPGLDNSVISIILNILND